MGNIWTFRTYVSPNGVPEVLQWYDAQSPKIQAAFDQRLRTLRQMEPHEWIEPYVKKLRGQCTGLVEIRFKADRVQHRPLGCYGPSNLEFTILLCAREIGDRFDPLDACAIALRRKKDVVYNPGATRRLTLD